MKIKVNHTFSFGGWTLWFWKVIELPSAPFYGLMVIDSNSSGDELSFTIKQDRDIISYDMYSKMYHVDIREYWKSGVRASNVDSEIENHKIFKWKRGDVTNIEEMKDLMISNYSK